MTGRDAAGFTLLEVLVAVFIMALVISFAFQAYQGIADAYTRVSGVKTTDRAARVLLDRLERELVGAVMIEREEGADPLLHPYLFLGQPLVQSDSEGFELRFVTQTPLRSPGSPPSTLAVVSYTTAASPSGQGLALLRQEEPLPAELTKETDWTGAQTVADNLTTFSLDFGLESAEGSQGWDSTSVAQLDQLPESIAVTVLFWETDEAGDPWPGTEFTRTVNLPVRPFRLAPEDTGEADEEADCGEGMTVAACLGNFQDELRAASTALQNAIQEARGQTSDTCWNPPAPSASLQRLKVLLGGLQGFDAEECQ